MTSRRLKIIFGPILLIAALGLSRMASVGPETPEGATGDVSDDMPQPSEGSPH